jgi:hypothetical protein
MHRTKDGCGRLFLRPAAGRSRFAGTHRAEDGHVLFILPDTAGKCNVFPRYSAVCAHFQGDFPAETAKFLDAWHGAW